MKNINKGLRLTQCIWIVVLLLVLSVGLFLVSPIAQAFTFTIIDIPGATRTVASGINPSGSIVGAFTDSTNKADHGFLLDRNGNLTTIDVPGATDTAALGINPSGDIVGNFFDSKGVQHGFLRSKRLRLNNSQTQELAAKGVFTKIIDVPGSIQTAASGINPSGDIVGSFIDFTGSLGHGFLLDRNGKFTRFNVPDSDGTFPLGINPSGDIVGNFLDSKGVQHGFLLDTKGNLITIEPSGSTFSSANGISPSGQIVGSFRDSSGVEHGFFASP